MFASRIRYAERFLDLCQIGIRRKESEERGVPSPRLEWYDLSINQDRLSEDKVYYLRGQPYKSELAMGEY